MAAVALLELDPHLASGLSVSEAGAARRALVVPSLTVRTGAWDARSLARVGESLLGTLVLDGMLARSTTLNGRATAHLFGPGDVVRPWAEEDTAAPMAIDAHWSALATTGVALLDRRFVALAARWPSILVELSRRSANQTSRVSMQVAIARIPRIDERLLMAFWRMGERWGRMTPQGIAIPFPLTHETIAALVAASRPPVSAALSQLARDELLQRTPEGWLLDRAVADQLRRSLGGTAAV